MNSQIRNTCKWANAYHVTETLPICCTLSQTCVDPESFDRGGPNLTGFFYERNTTLSGPSLANQKNAIIMAFHWHVDDGLTLNAGLVAL